ncbi:hypothetical protein DPMN_035379 [Dreissena polymorpha]|uniref:Uncharacterized protein n=1 Tax=Dreissena polymorpha TaxID=45954 RepID=A0A9D4M7F4_DREPO|nr:hypothetical protein DPMN_035379 [Dreissena polymorpha]
MEDATSLTPPSIALSTLNGRLHICQNWCAYSKHDCFGEGPKHSPSRVERIGVFADYTELSTRARLTLSGACPRRNSSRGIIGPGVTKDFKLMSNDDCF